MKPRIPIMLVTGSLGSGKTTLVRRIVGAADRRIAVVMNEFGEVAVDSKVLQGNNIQIVELLGGCVCCSLTGEFEAAVREIVDTIQPEFIVVEATGVAESDALVYEVQDNLPEVRLDCVVFVVDAYMSLKFPYVSHTMDTQLKAADVILINKIDQMTTDEVQTVESQIRQYNEKAVFFKTMGCDMDTKLLFGLAPLERPPVPWTHHGETTFQSFVYQTESCLDEEKFSRFISTLPPTIFRVKGFVRFCDACHLFNYVVGRADLEEFAADKTQLVFIGRCLESVREDVLRQLQECEALI
jgi:G3E family GTPase